MCLETESVPHDLPTVLHKLIHVSRCDMILPAAFFVTV